MPGPTDTETFVDFQGSLLSNLDTASHQVVIAAVTTKFERHPLSLQHVVEVWISEIGVFFEEVHPAF